MIAHTMTRENIARAFVLWDEAYTKDPGMFDGADPDPSGSRCADFFLTLIKEARSESSGVYLAGLRAERMDRA